jgi:uncharacterized protein (DUF1015 family)
MPEIRPFRALRYSAARVPDLSTVLAPPYDVISPEEREGLADLDPHNSVHLILPKERDGLTKYQAASRTLTTWIDEKILVRDDRPALYVMAQVFEHGGRRFVRRGVHARMRLHPFKDGVVLLHEKTLSGPKADRLELIKEVKANLSAIFGLFPDEDGEAETLLAELTSRTPDAEGKTGDGVTQKLWIVNGAPDVDAVRQIVANQKVFIADGHHRYETALNYRDLLDSTGRAPERGSHRYVLTFLCPMSDPGLVILPTHRVLLGLKRSLDDGDVRHELEKFFTIQPIHGALDKERDRTAALSRLADAGKKGPAFLVALADHALSLLLRLKPDANLDAVAGFPRNPALRALDAVVLHGLVMQHLLGLSVESQERQENLKYIKDPAEAVRRMAAGECQVAVFLNATPMPQVRAVAEAGETMPQKSTFFYPKLPSGLLMNPIDPKELAY